jgi:hypothetical protein
VRLTPISTVVAQTVTPDAIIAPTITCYQPYKATAYAYNRACHSP